jgi:hypothetical protein
MCAQFATAITTAEDPPTLNSPLSLVFVGLQQGVLLWLQKPRFRFF